MKGVQSSIKLVTLGATQRKGQAGMVEEWIRAPKYGGRRKDPCLKGNGQRCNSYEILGIWVVSKSNLVIV